MPLSRPIIIATRGSPLALAQSRQVAALLEAAHPGLVTELRIISTKGDQKLEVALSKIGDKGLFTAELEDSLRAGESDIAVHSLKDMPTEMPEGFVVGAVLEREDPRDLLILRSDVARNTLEERRERTRLSGMFERVMEHDLNETADESAVADALDCVPDGGLLGTSSLRRRAMVLSVRPDLEVRDLRGNVDTRLLKLANSDVDATVLAAAGLRRLGYWNPESGLLDVPKFRDELKAFPLPVGAFVPAAAQGAVAIECREGDARVLELISAINHKPTEVAVTMERRFLGAIGGGCQVPAGVHVRPSETAGKLDLIALIADPDGELMLPVEGEGLDPANPEPVDRMAATLLRSGGAEIVARCRQS
jgi:hydroxymethylbilane synthase